MTLPSERETGASLLCSLVIDIYGNVVAHSSDREAETSCFQAARL